MIKSFAALSITTGVRLLTGLVLFVWLAREWPAAQFGQFMYLFSIAALVVLACEFGFSQQILREVGKQPDQAPQLMSEYLGAKAWLTVGTLLLAALFVWLTKLSAHDTALLMALLAAAMLMSYTDFFMACLRALGTFSQEAKLTVVGNILYFGLALAALFWGDEGVWVAAAMAAARFIHLFMALRVFSQQLRTRLTINLSFKQSIRTIKTSSAYGADVAVGAAFTNLDNVLIAHALGTESVGIYQSISRIYQGMALFPAILGSIFLPRLSRATESPEQFQRNYRMMSWALLFGGLSAAMVFALGAPFLSIIYHDDYAARGLELLPWFALFVFVRFMASVYGVVLTALGRQSVRALIYVVALVFMVALAHPLMSIMGLGGMVVAITIAYAVLAILFAFFSRKDGHQPQAWKTATCISIGLMAFCFWKIGFRL